MKHTLEQDPQALLTNHFSDQYCKYTMLFMSGKPVSHPFYLGQGRHGININKTNKQT
jgi:hypothetical protein